VVTRTPVRLAGVPEWSFKSFLTSHPEVAYRMLQHMSRRLREAEKS
jgi:CRP-like cAMP-binding protein